MFFSLTALAKLNVVTTTTDLAAIVKEVGGDEVGVESIAKGTQDPHFIEAKPSYMVKVHNADLLVSVGLELETGWLPSIVQGARNSKVAAGSNGYFEVGPLANVIEVPTGKISRAEGDVHPDGNPHVTLSPKNVGILAVKVADKLSALDSAHAKDFKSRAEKLRTRVDTKFKEWKARIEKTGVKTVITYHKTLNYFLNDFGIANPINLEPKPGIPPTSKHILDVLNTVKTKNIKLILVENFFDSNVADRIKQDNKGVTVASVPVAVDGEPGIKTMDDLFEKLVKTVEGK